jgi:hypothetical protein
MNIPEIDWSRQHCGVRKATAAQVANLMPDLIPLLSTFPDDPGLFSWDVKVHLLMPRQYPCIPHWHTDNVPRVNGIQRFDQCDLTKPMYLWLSGAPLTQFTHGYVKPRVWHRFNQADQHRGSPAAEHGWRGFVRATHRDIVPCYTNADDMLRRHTQVYLDADVYQW